MTSPEAQCFFLKISLRRFTGSGEGTASSFVTFREIFIESENDRLFFTVFRLASDLFFLLPLKVFRFLLCLNNFHAVTNQESRSSLKGMLSGLYFKPVEEWLKTITKLSFIHVVKKRYNRYVIFNRK